MLQPLRYFRTHRSLVLLLATATALTTTAQDFAPLNASTKKLFASLPDHAATFSLAIDSAVTDGDVTHYYNFFSPSGTWGPSACPWWGSPDCMPLTQPTWAGPSIDADAGGACTFHNVWGQAITFPFQTDPLQPAVIFSDATQRFVLNYVGIAPGADVLGQTDDVRHWTIQHEDLDGVPIASALNGASVDVGDALGLIRFFRIDSFPQVLTPMELVGDANGQLGLYQLTPAIIHDHQPGDVVQWHEVGHAAPGPPSSNFDLYRTYVFLDREDGPEEVVYTVEQTLFDVPAQTTEVTTITLTYSSISVLAAIPFERFDGTTPQLGEGDHCGLRLWHYRTAPNPGLAYCADERCWGPYDTNGPPPTGHTDNIVGLGETFSIVQNSSIGGPSGSGSRDLVYFEKDGTSCGSEVIMGIGDGAMQVPAVRISPVPTDGALTLEADGAMTSLVVHDLAGARVLDVPLSGTRTQVDVGALRTGVYVGTVRFAGGAQAMMRVVVAGN